MSQNENGAKKKIRGQIPAKIVWIIGSIVSAVFMMERFLAIGEEYETTSDCVVDGVRFVIYLAAFVTGLIYLFDKRQKKLVLVTAAVYAVTAVYNLFAELFDGGKTSAETVIISVITILAYLVSAGIIKLYTDGKESGLLTTARKFWFGPAALLLITALVESIITEIHDTYGFDFSLVIVDMLFALVLVLPMFTMIFAVRERTKAE